MKKKTELGGFKTAKDNLILNIKLIAVLYPISSNRSKNKRNSNRETNVFRETVSAVDPGFFKYKCPVLLGLSGGISVEKIVLREKGDIIAFSSIFEIFL